MLAHPILHWETTAMAFSTTGTSRGDGLSSEINVTPLIDVLLVMLIIFMVIVPVMPRGLNCALPSPATPGVAEAAEHPILVQVEQGQTAVRYRVDGVGVERAEVAARLVELLSRRSVRQVLLRADAKLDFGVIAGVINAGQAAGAESIGLLTPGSDGSDRLPR
jgi:biopolymer transport protein ExbD